MPQNLDYLDGQVRRDRNHPSVFIWSLFNEESRQTSPDSGALRGDHAAAGSSAGPDPPMHRRRQRRQRA